MKRAIGIAALLGAAALAGASLVAQTKLPVPDSRLTGGNGTLYIGGYPNLLWMIDEATEKVVGTIHTKSGIPRRLNLTRDKKLFYIIDATQEAVEVVDIASKTTLDTFKLTEGNKRVRINSIEPDPTNRYAILLTRTDVKLTDRVDIGPSVLLQYDLKEHKIIRTIDWPDGQERDQANLLFSPDGKFLYFLGNEILIFETEKFTQVDKWDLSNLEEGLGQVSVSFGFPEEKLTARFVLGLFFTSWITAASVICEALSAITELGVALDEELACSGAPATNVTSAFLKGTLGADVVSDAVHV